MIEGALRCHICSSARLKEKPFGYSFHGKWLTAVECKECGILFIHPQPSPEEIGELYSKEYFERDFRCGHEASYFDEKTLAGIVDQSLLKRIGDHTPAGQFLEIGCAGGAFLDAARTRGYRVHGVEYSKDAAQFAKERFGLDVHVGDVLDAHFPDGFFDIVFMGDVIEHMSHPVATLKEIRRITSVGGLLVIVCPSQTNTLFSRIGFFLFGSLGIRARVNLPPYHLFEYRPGSIRFLLEICGFDISRMSEAIMSPAGIALRGSVFQRTGKKVMQYPNYALTRMFGIFGDRMEIFAVKRQ